MRMEDGFLATDEEGHLWRGILIEIESEAVTSNSDDSDYVVKWTPLNGPPDGEFWNKRKDFWDRLEEKIRNDSERTRTPDGG